MIKEPYKSVKCDFYDELENFATLKKVCQILYRDQTGKEQLIKGHIVDLYTKDHAEFLKMTDGFVIRLDQIVGVDGISSHSFSDK